MTVAAAWMAESAMKRISSGMGMIHSSTLLLIVSAPIRRKAQSRIAARVASGVAMFTSLRSDAAQTRASFLS